jgi:hypothetical protein
MTSYYDLESISMEQPSLPSGCSLKLACKKNTQKDTTLYYEGFSCKTKTRTYNIVNAVNLDILPGMITT